MCTEPLRNSINYLQTISTTPRDASSSVEVSTFPSSPGTSKCLTLSLLKNVMFFSKLLLDISVVCVYGNYRTATKMRINRIDILISVLVKKQPPPPKKQPKKIKGKLNKRKAQAQKSTFSEVSFVNVW